MAEHEAEHIDVDPQPLAAIWGTNQIMFVYMTGVGILVAMAALTLLF
jgi:hypothetical protein